MTTVKLEFNAIDEESALIIIDTIFNGIHNVDKSVIPTASLYVNDSLWVVRTHPSGVIHVVPLEQVLPDESQ